METAGEGAATLRALLEKKGAHALVGKAPVKQGGAGKQPQALLDVEEKGVDALLDKAPVKQGSAGKQPQALLDLEEKGVDALLDKAPVKQGSASKQPQALLEEKGREVMAPVKQGGAGNQPQALLEEMAPVEEKEATMGSSSSEPAHKQKNPRKGDDEKKKASRRRGRAKRRRLPKDHDEDKAGKKGGGDDDDDDDEEAAAKGKGEGEGDKANLSLDIVVNIVARLPSKDAACCAVLNKDCDRRLREPSFLKTHLAPARPYYLRHCDDAPNRLLFLKPTGEAALPGYTHLTIIRSGNNNVVYDMPVRAAFDDEYHLPPDPRGPPCPQADTFFHNTIPQLDLNVKAAEGRLLLGYSGKHGCFFLCNPSLKRFIRLPTPPHPLLEVNTVAGIRYEHESSGEMKFSVVLLSELPGTAHEFVVQSFSSEGGWIADRMQDEKVAPVLAEVSRPGIYATDTSSFYWINVKSGDMIGYNLDERRAFLVKPPPPATKAHPIRVGWALGSTAGRLRISSFSVGPQAEDKPYVQIQVPGLLSVWKMTDNGTGWSWTSQMDVSVPTVWILQFFKRIELPMDAARADPSSLLVVKDMNLLLRPLEEVVQGGAGHFLFELYKNRDAYLGKIYESCEAFCVFC